MVLLGHPGGLAYCSGSEALRISHQHEHAIISLPGMLTSVFYLLHASGLQPASNTLRLRGAGGAGKVGVWDTSSGQCKRMLEGPTGTIEWLHWHPKGDVILAGSDDFTAWLWNAETGANMRVRTTCCLESASLFSLMTLEGSVSLPA